MEGPARDLYEAAVLQARQPGFYRALGVPDTVDGRFDLISLHVFLLLHRLSALTEAKLTQALFDCFFADMDVNLREMGAGDLGVGKRVKKMARAFMGRVAAYQTALDDAAPGALVEALRRNVYRGGEGAAGELAAYVRRQVERLNEQPIERLRSGQVQFGEAP